MGHNIESSLIQALNKLEKAEWEVNRLLCRGTITQEFADIILLKLHQAQEDIKGIKNSI